ncbi:MAG: toll/interleukin-1 receptor domain-containing protein [Anaerolineales bacterium]|nr:toll/interleukin-1 receptor domain-containing protein [Anaerolineales bacterium]
MTLPTVFISYSHNDEKEKNELVTQLSVLKSHGLIKLWSDDEIGAGGDWKSDIEQAMDQAEVGVLLITANFLTSNFILETEAPRLLLRRRDEGITVFPIIAKYCDWQSVEWLTKMNVRPKNGAPVWRQGGIHADEELAKIASEIRALLQKKAAGGTSHPAPGASLADLVSSPPAPTPPSAAIPSTEMTKIQKQKLVQALLACSSMSDRNKRDAIIDDLSPNIKHSIDRNSADVFDVMNIVNACLNYEGGLQELIDTMEFYEGSALPMQRVKDLLGHL